MKQEHFQLVAELYHFLATFNAASISAASKLPGLSENMRCALRALQREATNQRTSREQTVHVGPIRMSKNSGMRSPIDILMDKRRFPTKNELIEITRLLGLRIPANPRDSKLRVAQRIAKAIGKDSSTLQAFYETVDARDSQTSGWIDVIRRGS